MSQDVGELATRLIEIREELQDIGEHVEALDIRDREVLVEIFDDQAELCLQLAQALEVRAPFDPKDHKLDEDQVLTDGGQEKPVRVVRPAGEVRGFDPAAGVVLLLLIAIVLAGVLVTVVMLA